ncbi:hypothetical protein MCOR25_006697 [Pyricularia grisea]|nr:hypothetical protein MCOR25_006697 [Pyricularia grisea]
MTRTRAGLDKVAWDKNDEDSEQSQRKLRHKLICRQVKDLVERTFQERAKLVSPLIIGGFRILYRFEFERQGENRDELLTRSDILVRLPIPHLAQFPDEKTHQEATTARLVRQTTDLPLPQVLHHGRDEMLGSHLIIQYVEHQRDMCDALAIPTDDFSLTPVPNPDLSGSELKNLYGKMARCLLQLYRLSFPRIGSLLEDECGNISVAGRPVTQNMNNMLQLADIPRSVLPKQSKTYNTTDEWYTALAEMHMAQLVFQHNALVTSEDDCRKKIRRPSVFP